MENHDVQAVMRYLYLKETTPCKFFNDMKQTSGESAPAYDIITKYNGKFK